MRSASVLQPMAWPDPGPQSKMSDPPREALTRLLNTASASEQTEAELLTALYGELRKMAAGLLRDERAFHTLQATALLHEAWARMVDPNHLDQVDPEAARRRFLALAARTMRRVLIDHARKRAADKRGGDRNRVTLDSGVIAPEVDSADLLDVEAALVKLEQWSPRLARIAEMRLFAGLDRHEVAAALGVSVTTAADEWALARALLAENLR